MAAAGRVTPLTFEQLRDVRVCPPHFNQLATIFQDDKENGLRYANLYNTIGLRKADLAALSFEMYQRESRLGNAYETYGNMISKWHSFKGNLATFGHLLTILETIEWTSARQAILMTNWEGVSIPDGPPPQIQRAENESIRELALENQRELVQEAGLPKKNLIELFGEEVDGLLKGIDWTNNEQLEVQVTRSNSPFNERGSECYPMQSTPRGMVLIINNERKFSKNPDGSSRMRRGSQIDASYMRDLFGQLGFKVWIANNVSTVDLQWQIKQFKSKLASSKDKIDCIVVVVMSHGNFGNVEMEDGNLVDIYKDIIYQFNNQNCKILEGKPKVFIFQACQNIKVPPETNSEGVQTNADMSDDTNNLSTSDILIGFPSAPGQSAYRNEEKGSRYIYALTKVLMENAHKCDVQDMLQNQVAAEMNNMTHVHDPEKPPERQVASTSILGGFKQLYFNV